MDEFSKEEIIRLVLRLKKEFNIADSELEVKKKVDSLPVSIFVAELGPLECVVKYLKENLNYGFKKIAMVLNRNIHTIYQAYDHAKKKYPVGLEIDYSKNIPISVLSLRPYSILELVVKHLKEKEGMRNNEIARLLNRDPRTIWTAYSRYKKKKYGKKRKDQ